MRSAVRPLLTFLVTALLLGCTIAGCASRPKDEPHPATVELRKTIAGKENYPAREVFHNVQLLENVTAGRLLTIMESSFSRGLGVHCEQCHAPDGRWDSDEKRAKLAAREMMVMTREVNAALAKMKNLDESEPAAQCVTCHRGKLKPPPYVE
jgi:cytochrome c553